MTKKIYEGAPITTDAGALHLLRGREAGSWIRMTASGYTKIVIPAAVTEGIPENAEFFLCNAADDDPYADGDDATWTALIAEDGVTLRRAWVQGGWPEALVLVPGQVLMLKRTARDEFFVHGPRRRQFLSDSGANHDITYEDAWSYLRMTKNDGGAKTVTFRPESTEALPNYADWYIGNLGEESGNLTLVAGGGVTLTPPEGGTLVLEPNMYVTVTRVAADQFLVTGETVPAE